MAERAGLSVGTLSITVSFVVLLAWIPLRQQPGIGTFANAIWVGLSIDLGIALLPPAPNFLPAVMLMVAGVLLNGVSCAVYIGAQLGTGARDGLRTGLGRVLGRPVGPVRIGLEVLVLIAGWALGGPVGVATLLYAAGLGPVVQLTLPHVVIPVRSAAGDAPAEALEETPPPDPA